MIYSWPRQFCHECICFKDPLNYESFSKGRVTWHNAAANMEDLWGICLDMTLDDFRSVYISLFELSNSNCCHKLETAWKARDQYAGKEKSFEKTMKKYSLKSVSAYPQKSKRNKYFKWNYYVLLSSSLLMEETAASEQKKNLLCTSFIYLKRFLELFIFWIKCFLEKHWMESFFFTVTLPGFSYLKASFII